MCVAHSALLPDSGIIYLDNNDFFKKHTPNLSEGLHLIWALATFLYITLINENAKLMDISKGGATGGHSIDCFVGIHRAPSRNRNRYRNRFS
ncbi:MAG TPA: hypothetical protein EYQ50_25470 [Verrucomicrobiales bacterium]|jgi:hypothetical protein|nr:hypothetical protein [Verrucomicrobiales bacterium]